MVSGLVPVAAFFSSAAVANMVLTASTVMILVSVFIELLFVWGGWSARVKTPGEFPKRAGRE